MRITNTHMNDYMTRSECQHICTGSGQISRAVCKRTPRHSGYKGWSMHSYGGEKGYIRQTWYML